MNILAIETSCDETSVAVVKDGTDVLSIETATSLALHATTGGIIPENAARKQIEYIIPTLETALKKAFPNIDISNRKEIFKNIDSIAVTTGPGLIGSLLVGVETAKTLAAMFNKPLIPVNHIKAHVYGCFLKQDENWQAPQFPLLALVVSGGHTDFVFMKSHGSYEWLGGTRDDAAGECFDKCARLLKLPYPGGPSISKMATEFRNENPDFKLNLFPRPMIHDDTYDLSFSGLKTSVLYFLKDQKEVTVQLTKQLAAEIEEAICETLVLKSMKIINEINPQNFVICGGVSANFRLKFMAKKALQLTKVPEGFLHVPENKYSTDNAAMIGSYAFYNNKPKDISDIFANPELDFTSHF